jgi:hypothetical protein
MDLPTLCIRHEYGSFHSASEKVMYFLLRLFVPLLILSLSLFFSYFPFILPSFFPPFLSFCISFYVPFRFLFSPFFLPLFFSLLISSSFLSFLLSFYPNNSSFVTRLSFFIPLLPVSFSCSLSALLHSVQQCSNLTNNVSVCYSNLQRGS